MTNKTARDAYLRVLGARMGSLADDPSEDYLTRLELELVWWLVSVREARSSGHPQSTVDVEKEER